MTLRIKLFGSLELERDGRPLARFASRKSGELFAYLALNRKAPHTREHLAGVFWGDSAEERARHALNTTLWRINRVLEPPESAASDAAICAITPQHIGFNAASDSGWTSPNSRPAASSPSRRGADQFALYAQAVNLYRGDLLADCYEDWCIVERERLQGLYVRALAHLMAHNSSHAEYDLAIDCARRILGCDPLREEVHRDLMRLHLEAGQPAAALRQYRQCEDMLRDELGVDPAPETRALLTPILGATSGPDEPGGCAAPRPSPRPGGGGDQDRGPGGGVRRGPGAAARSDDAAARAHRRAAAGAPAHCPRASAARSEEAV